MSGSNVGAAAASGDRLKLLKALRDRIALEIEDCPTRDLSPLTRRLQDIVSDISELEEQQKQENPGGSRSGRGKETPGWTPDENV